MMPMDEDPFAQWEASLEPAAPAEQNAPAEAPGNPQEPPEAEIDREGALEHIDTLAAVFSQPPDAVAEGSEEPAAVPVDAVDAVDGEDADSIAKAAAMAAFYQLRAAKAAAADAARGIEGHGYVVTARPEQLDQLHAALIQWLTGPDTPEARARTAQLRQAAAVVQLGVTRAAAAPHADLIAVLQAAGELPAEEV